MEKLNNKNQTMFIKTKDEKTSEKMKQEGFELVDYSNGVWTFVNSPKHSLIFENNKVAYSNMLCV